MRALLMYPDRDFDPDAELPYHAADLVEDLALDQLFAVMAGGDAYLTGVCRPAVLCGLDDVRLIEYRQQVLLDCLQYPDTVRRLYAITTEAHRVHRRIMVSGLRRSPQAVVRHAVDVLEAFVGLLRQLRDTAAAHRQQFRSSGMTTLCAMLASELSDEYLATVHRHLGQLRFPNGVLVESRLGKGNKSTGFTLCSVEQPQGWFRLRPADRPAGLCYRIGKNDEVSAQMRDQLESKCLGATAELLTGFSSNVSRFFQALRCELGFYVGCVNLHGHLTAKGEPVCMPVPAPPGELVLSASGLYDPALSVCLGPARAVGNDLAADGRMLVMVTGANRGGKSTLLRGIGLAQLMMQCGMFVAAAEFRANVCTGVATHFRRGEDSSMTSGKLDEELARMSQLADHLTPGYLALFNESFAATNEREGSQIARDVVGALCDAGIKTVFVTHLFELAQQLYAETAPGSPVSEPIVADPDAVLFLRAQRAPDGQRSFKVVPGTPLETGYGTDLYQQIFGADGPERVGRPAAGGR